MADEEPPAPPPDSPPAPPDDGDSSVPSVPTVQSDYYFPIYVATASFGALFIILPLLVRKGSNKGIVKCCMMLTIFCMWIFWVTVYIAQMNPLFGPRVKNTSLAWIAYKVGDPAKVESPVEEKGQEEAPAEMPQEAEF